MPDNEIIKLCSAPASLASSPSLFSPAPPVSRGPVPVLLCFFSFLFLFFYFYNSTEYSSRFVLSYKII
jgi:hypothetical protein